jgi:hypothetical protein
MDQPDQDSFKLVAAIALGAISAALCALPAGAVGRAEGDGTALPARQRLDRWRRCYGIIGRASLAGGGEPLGLTAALARRRRVGRVYCSGPRQRKRRLTAPEAPVYADPVPPDAFHPTAALLW